MEVDSPGFESRLSTGQARIWDELVTALSLGLLMAAGISRLWKVSSAVQM